jgi:hypothetical protein
MVINRFILKIQSLFYYNLGQQGFFTEGHPQQQKNKPKLRRNLFKKAAVGILFYYVLKHRAAKNRLVSPKQPYFL